MVFVNYDNFCQDINYATTYKLAGDLALRPPEAGEEQNIAPLIE
jgi:hypothetical protein